MPNEKYSFHVVKRNLVQLNIEVLPSRMWVETVFLNTTDPQLYPYIEWCSGLTLDLPTMEAKIDLSHIPHGTELVNREVKPNARPQMDPFATVQNFITLGLIQDDTKQSLLEALRDLIDEQIQIAKDAKEKNSFAFPQRIIQSFINRWSKISRALHVVTKPHKVYGDNVFNLPPEADDKKKRKDRDPSSSTTPGVDDEEKGINQQANADGDVNMNNNDDDSDRQNLRGGGGNPK
jgi:hypothetical protein